MFSCQIISRKYYVLYIDHWLFLKKLPLTKFSYNYEKGTRWGGKCCLFKVFRLNKKKCQPYIVMVLF